MTNFLLRNLELVFTTAGLLVILGVTGLIQPAGVSPWAVAAITAILVGVVHGALFWVVRCRQRLVRRDALADTQRMLRDIVVNQLAVIRINADLQSSSGRRNTADTLAHLEKAMGIIDQALSDISEESLARWQSRYDTSGRAPGS